LTRPNVTLIPSAVVELTENGVVDDDGVYHDADIVIFATGFKTTDYLSRLPVRGRDGLSLNDAWKSNGPSALLGLMVPRFPNFYMIYGPGTNGGAPITFNAERQAAFILRNIKRMKRAGLATLEVRSSFVYWYNRWYDWQNSKTVWAKANNSMKLPSGRIVTNWPLDLVTMVLLLWILRRPAVRGNRRRRA